MFWRLSEPIAAAVATALASGKSSARRTSSSILMSSVGVSDKVVALMRSTSRAMARCSGLSLGCAARNTRWSAVFNAASSGSTLPVSCACCCARRTVDSISTTRFSSRERDRLCISSSSWVRCRATSLNLASDTASLAAVSCASSWAALAIMRASIDWAPESALCRANCSCMLDSFCHSKPLVIKATTATAPTTSNSTVAPRFSALRKDGVATDNPASPG